MLVNGKRALAYTAVCGPITPIEGADNIDLMQIDGWKLIVKKGEFKEGDICVYFETDSKLPERPWSEFMAPKHYKVKIMKLSKFGVWSEGLALPLSVFTENVPHEAGVDVTELLGVTYSVAEDNVRKASNKELKYNSMASRHQKLFKKKPFRWLMRREWGRKLLFVFFGKKKDSPKGFPTHFPYVKKTDEERAENIPQILNDKEPWVVTSKCDGTSATYILEKKKHGKYEFYVCSRNVRQKDMNQKNYHADDENVYWQAAFKYHIREFLENYMETVDFLHLDYVCLQGEICGVSEGGKAIQGDPHKLKELRFFGFNFIRSDIGREDTLEAKRICELYDIDWVPIVNEHYILPDDFEEFKQSADGPCDIPGGSGLREGLVYRKVGNAAQSFKNVSRKYMQKHSG